MGGGSPRRRLLNDGQHTCLDSLGNGPGQRAEGYLRVWLILRASASSAIVGGKEEKAFVGRRHKFLQTKTHQQTTCTVHQPSQAFFLKYMCQAQRSESRSLEVGSFFGTVISMQRRDGEGSS